jgi:regulator of sirC expression with transglutaminase-like and TPR domain
MCQSCVDMDKLVERLREQLQSIADPAERERAARLIAELYADRVRFHQNPDTYEGSVRFSHFSRQRFATIGA